MRKNNFYLGLLFLFSIEFSGSGNMCYYFFLLRVVRKVNYIKVLRNYNLCINI